MMNRIYPDFLVIGANKAGTTSLHEYLGQHPDIYTTPVKEPTFFCLDGQPVPDEAHMKDVAINSPERYRALFNDVTHEKMTGESSTAYLANPGVTAKIKAWNPDMKIVAVLRHPVERAFSNWMMYVRWGRETVSFTRCVNEEMVHGAANRPQGMRYLTLGLYAGALRAYIDTFGRDRVCVLLFDDFQQDAAAFTQHIYRFLGVDPAFRPRVETRRNTNAAVRTGWRKSILCQLEKYPALKHMLPARLYRFIDRKPTLRNRTRNRLLQWYEIEFTELEDLLNIPLDRWRYRQP
jgi:hypothetical protein